jgi:hypothetical protein
MLAWYFLVEVYEFIIACACHFVRVIAHYFPNLVCAVMRSHPSA